MNIFGASGGHVHGASAICLGQVVYHWYFQKALKEAVEGGGNINDILARDFGMTPEEFEIYKGAHDYPYQWEDMHELQQWKDEHDPLIQLTNMIGAKYGYHHL